MSLFTKKILYAVQIMYLLQRDHKSRVQAKALAAMMQVSAAFVEQILHLLKKEGLLESVRGAQGGFSLSKPSCEISIREIVSAIEPNACAIAPQGSVALDAFWGDFTQKCHEVLDLKLCEVDTQFTPLMYEI